MFGIGGANVPGKVKEAGMAKWYSSLSNQDKVRLRRYLDFADTRSGASFIVSVCVAAAEDHNYRFAVSVYESAPNVRFTDLQRYDMNESAVIAYFNTENYEKCLELCDLGLSMLKIPEVREHVLAGSDVFPENISCRNYKINVLAGCMRKYDESMEVLDGYAADGLISEEEAEHRKNSIRTYKLQKTFDGIFSRTEEKDRRRRLLQAIWGTTSTAGSS